MLRISKVNHQPGRAQATSAFMNRVMPGSLIEIHFRFMAINRFLVSLESPRNRLSDAIIAVNNIYATPFGLKINREDG